MSMGADSIVAVIFGVLNVALTAFLFIRKESKRDAERREAELNRKLEICEGDKEKLRVEYHQLERKCDQMEARQQTFESMMPHYVQVVPRPGGKRGYDDPGGGHKG